jgi:hypothetical protein
VLSSGAEHLADLGCLASTSASKSVRADDGQGERRMARATSTVSPSRSARVARRVRRP